MSGVDSAGMAVANKGANERTVNNGGYETRVTAAVGAGRESMRTSTFNASMAAHLFEDRAAQETGTH